MENNPKIDDDIKMNLYDKLSNQIENEYNEYKKNKLCKEPKKIFEEAYEIVCFYDIKCCLNTMIENENLDLICLKIPNLINSVFQEFLSTDYTLCYENLFECVEEVSRIQHLDDQENNEGEM